MKILLVVEDGVTRGLLKGLFSQRGHDVEGCRDSEAGWDAYNRESCPVVVVEAAPGRTEGLDFCRSLRAHPRGRESQVIVLTPPGFVLAPDALLEAGVDDVLASPVDLDQAAGRIALAEGRLERLRERARPTDDRAHATGESRTLLELSPVGMGFTNAEGRIVAANEAFLHLMGVERGEIGGGLLGWGDLVDGPPLTELARALKPPEGGCTTLELVRRDRARVPVLMSVTPTRGGAGHVVVVFDTTGLERQHRQAFEEEKLEAMGRLARGVEQHLNNLFATVTGYSELLLAELDPVDPRFEYLREIRQAADQATAVSRQLLVFSRGQVLAPRVLDLNAVVVRVEKMLGRMMGDAIRITLDLAPDLGRVRVDLVQLEKMILALAVNAREAMPGGGTLSLATSPVDVTSEAKVGNLAPGPYVALTVTDTGHGMKPETLARVFEPFFTTHPVGSHVGLGLAVVHGVVQQSGGHIEVESAPGKGARFVVHLPMSGEGGEAPEEDRSAVLLPRGLETVILVDPESSVRVFARMVLSRCGYRVLEATSGERALRIVQEEPGPHHLLVTTLDLPGLDGVDVAERVAALEGDIRVLFILGPGDDEDIRRRLAERSAATLEKPFAPAALARKVREVLDA